MSYGEGRKPIARLIKALRYKQCPKVHFAACRGVAVAEMVGLGFIRLDM